MAEKTEAQKQLERYRRELLKRAFETVWRALEGPELQEEFEFHPERGWRFDFCHLPTKAAVELEGGTWLDKGGHTTGKGYSKDCQKYNEAQLLGYRVFRFTSDMIANNPIGHLRPIIELMRKAI